MSERYDALDAQVPLLLLPLRLETRSEPIAAGWNLRVRVYPDEASLSTVAHGVSDAEAEAARDWWRTAWAAASTPDEAPDPWEGFVAAVGPDRAPWVAEALRPTNPQDRGSAEPVFPQPPGPDAAPPPRAVLLPDALRVVVRQSGTTVSETGAPIPSGGVPTGNADGDTEALARSLVHLTGGGGGGDDPLAWITDFAAAERVGLGIRVELPHGDAPVERVTVVGVRTTSDPESTAAAVAQLLSAHHHGAGAAVPPVGTLTNNTADRRAAWSRVGSRPGRPPVDVPAHPSAAAGPVLSGALGLPASTFGGWEGADHEGGSWAEAMTAALWPVTWDGFLDRVLARPLTGTTKEALRRHARHVRGRGPLAPLRLGRQPYGVLPVTSLQAFTDADPTVGAVAGVLRRLAPLWRSAAAGVPSVAGGDLARVLPEILGQAPVSRSVRVRRALGLGGPLGAVAEKVDPAELAGRRALLRVAEAVLGLTGGTLGDPVALGRQRLLGLPLADDSDPSVLAAILDAERAAVEHASVLQVLLTLSEGQTRAAVERLTERERWQVMSSRLRETIGEIGERRAELLAEGLQVVGEGAFGESERILEAASAVDQPDAPWSPDRFLRRFPVERLRPHPIDVARDGDATGVLEAVATTLRAAAAHVEVRESIATLAGVESTDERARLLAEALDCASHRYDAWVTSLATHRLARIRATRPTGLALGAYGAVEDLLIREARTVENPPEGVAAGVLEPLHDGGAIIAPSTAHAATAAVLRGARLSHEPGDRVDKALEMDLSSTRTRAALSVLDGVRAGQPLGALLGYRFERALHEADRALNAYIPSLRTLAPLVAAKDTERVPSGPAPAALESVAAGDVVDGLRLRALYLAERDEEGGLPPGSSIVERLAAKPPGHGRYVEGEWPRPGKAQLGLIVEALKGLDSLLDAVTDLLLAEGVHQLVGGDPTRSAAAMDAMAGDAIPAEPDVLSPPVSGSAFTHRLLVLAPARASSARTGWTATPRSAVDPSLEAWARTALGPASSIILDAHTGGAPTARLSDATLSALDFVAATGGTPALLWARLRRMVPHLPAALPRSRPRRLAGSLLSFPEAWALAASLRRLLSGARPALPSDLAPPGADETTLRGVDLAELRARAGRTRQRLAAIPAEVTGRRRRLRIADRFAGAGIGGAVDPASLSSAELGAHLEQLARERDRRVAAADDALAAYDSEPPDLIPGRVAALADVFTTLVADGLPVLPVLTRSTARSDPFVAAWGAPASSTSDGAAIRPWLATAARVRPAAARLAETVIGREAVGARTGLRVVQMPATGPSRWVGLPFEDGLSPIDAVTACVVNAPSDLRPRRRCVGLVVDSWTETVPRRRATTDGPQDLVTAGVAVHANGPDARAPQALLLAVTPDGRPWTWERVAGIVEETLALARARMVTLERAPLGGALLPAIWAQDWSLRGEPVPDPRLLSRLDDARAVVPYVRELEV